MLVLVILTFLPALHSFFMGPINIETCPDHVMVVRDFIVYSCQVNETSRSLVAIGCDHTNGFNTRLHLAPLFPGRQEHYDKFVYECQKNASDGTITYQATACWNGREGFGPAKVADGPYMSTLLCYRGFDGLLRTRVMRPVHSRCDKSRGSSFACKLGVTQTVFNSNFGKGEPFSVDAKSLLPTGKIRKMAAPHKNGTHDVPRGLLLKALTGEVDPDDFLVPTRIGY